MQLKMQKPIGSKRRALPTAVLTKYLKLPYCYTTSQILQTCPITPLIMITWIEKEL